MKPAAPAPDENERLAALRDYRVLDTPPESVFDELTQLAANLFEVPIVLVSLVDEHRQWFKSRVGVAVQELSREDSFCGHAILEQDLMVVPDVSCDERFADNPLVTGEFKVGFYAGMPLINAEGRALGTLCLKDHRPRDLSESQRQTLRVLGRQVMAQLELRRRGFQLESERGRLDQVLEAAHTGYYEWNLSADRRRWSRGHEQLWGYAPGEYDGSYEGFSGRIHPDDLPVVEAAIMRSRESGEFDTTEYRVVHPDGTELWVEGNGRYYHDDSGRLVSMRGVVRDITERKRNELMLKHSQAELEQAQQIGNMGGWEYRVADGRIRWSDQLYRIFGLKPQAEEITYKRLRELIHPDDRLLHDTAFERLLKVSPGDVFEPLSYRIVKPDGETVHAKVQINAVHDAAGKLESLMGTVQDVTADKRVREDLRLKDLAIQSTATGICFTGMDGKLIDANPAALRIWGFDKVEEIRGTAISWLGSSPAIIAEIREAMLAQGFYSGEDLSRRRDGSRITVQFTTALIRDTAGQPIGVMTTFMDISAKVATERALAEREAKLRLFVEHSPAAIVMFDREMRYLEVSRRWLEHHRLEGQDIVGLCHYDVFTEMPERWREIHRRCLAGAIERSDEDSFVREDGTVVWLRWEIRPWHEADGSVGGIVIFSEDVSAAKEAELAITQSQRRLRDLIDGIGPSIYVALMDRDGVILEVGDSALQASGRRSDEMVGHRMDKIAPWTHSPEAQDRMRRSLKAAARGESLRYDAQVLMAHGRISEIDFSLNPLCNEQGEVTYLVASAVDITQRKEAEAKTRDQEGILRETGRIAHVGGWEFDPATGEGTWTEEVARIHDIDPGTPPSKSLGLAFYAEESRPIIAAAVEAAISDGTEYDLELELISAKGVRKWVRTIGRPIIEAGRVVKVRGSIQDVTERREAEARIRQLNRTYLVLSQVNQMIVRERDPSRLLAEVCRIAVEDGEFRMAWIGLWAEAPGSMDVVAHAGADSETVAIVERLMAAGSEGCRFTADALTMGQHGICQDIATDPTAANWREEALSRGYRSMASLPLFSGEKVIGNFNLYAGSEGFFEGEEVKLLDELAADISFSLGVGRLEVERAQFGSVMEASLNEIYLFETENLRFRFVNAGARSNLGYSSEALCRCTPLEIQPEFPDAVFRRMLEPLLQGTQSKLRFETVHRRADGSEYPVEVHLQLVEQSGERVFLAVVVDLTERKQAESALRKSEQQLSNALKIAALGPWEFDVASEVFTFNDHFYALMRTTAEREGGYTLAAADYAKRFCLQEEVAVVAEETRKAIETKDPNYTSKLEHKVTFGDGEPGLVSVRIFVVKDEQGRTIRTYGVNQDITERRQAEQAALRVERRYRAIIEHSTDAIMLYDREAQVLYASPSMEKIEGYSPAELLQRNGLEGNHPDEQALIEKTMGNVMARPGDPISFVFRRRHRDGRWLWVEGVATNLLDDSSVAAIVVNYRDVTASRQLEEQFRQSQKMEAIGQLAGGVAHDFNNILAAILMQAQLAGESAGSPSTVKRLTREIASATQRGAALTRQLLAFSRQQVIQTRELNLNEVVTNITRMLQRILGEDINLQLNLNASALFTRADAGMLDQILLNLVVNARDAMPTGGKLVIETKRCVLAGEKVKFPDMPDGRYVSLLVSDSGCGMSAETKLRVFEPFFTTKETGKGTGLGLATVFGIVKQHEGAIFVESEEGVGTTFEIILPACDGVEVVEEENEAEPLASVSGNETILLVEDEPSVRMLTEMILGHAGFDVITAADGPEGIAAWHASGRPIHLLLTDMVMPQGMTGRDLSDQLLAQNPDLKVVFTSGYSAAMAGQELDLQPGQAFVQKPCAPIELLNIIRELLDG